MLVLSAFAQRGASQGRAGLGRELPTGARVAGVFIFVHCDTKRRRVYDVALLVFFWAPFFSFFFFVLPTPSTLVSFFVFFLACEAALSRNFAMISLSAPFCCSNASFRSSSLSWQRSENRSAGRGCQKIVQQCVARPSRPRSQRTKAGAFKQARQTASTPQHKRLAQCSKRLHAHVLPLVPQKIPAQREQDPHPGCPHL